MPRRRCVESQGEKQRGRCHSFEGYPSDSTFPLRERRRSVFHSPEMVAMNYKRSRQRWQSANRGLKLLMERGSIIASPLFYYLVMCVDLRFLKSGKITAADRKLFKKRFIDCFFCLTVKSCFGFMSSVLSVNKQDKNAETQYWEKRRLYYSSSM